MGITDIQKQLEADAINHRPVDADTNPLPEPGPRRTHYLLNTDLGDPAIVPPHDADDEEDLPDGTTRPVYSEVLVARIVRKDGTVITVDYEGVVTES